MDLPQTLARIESRTDGARARADLGLACLEALGAAPDPELGRRVHLAIGIALGELERFADALEHLDAGARLSRETKNDSSLAHCLWLHASAEFRLGRLDPAAERATEGIDAAESAGWDDALWRLANVLGLIEERRGNSTAALEAFRIGQEAADRVVEETGNPEGVAVLLSNVGITYMNLGEHDQALEIYQRALELQLQTPTQAGLPSALANVGDVLIHLGRLEEAREHHQEALALRRELGMETELALSHHSLGSISLAEERFEEALVEFERALEIRQRLGLAAETAATLSSMAQAHAGLDQREEALAAAHKGLSLTDRLALKGRRQAVLEALGKVHAQLGNHAEALQALGQATEIERSQRSLETRKQLAAFRAELEAKEQEQKIALLSRERDLQDLALRKQRFERNALLAGTAFAMLVGLAGWVAWASLRRATKRIAALEEDRIRADKLESIGVLAGGIAHDFNNVLAALLGNLSLLRLATPDDDSVKELLQGADQALDQGKKLSSQLLSFAKGGVLTTEPQDLEPLIRQATNLSLAGSRSRAEISLDPELHFADVDSGQFLQLITNVVLNADQAMPAGGVVRIGADNVELSTGEHGQLAAGPHVRITIGDEGAGIDTTIRDKVFDPFFTTKRGGSGLGLALAHAIVTRHGGAIDHCPNAEGGATFEVLLPAAPRSERQDAPAERAMRTGAGRVLVMDDDPLVRKVFGSGLRQLGYECDLVEDGEAAVQLYREALGTSRPFRLAILDLTIPGRMGGRETIARLLECDPDVRAIVSSGYSDDRLLEGFHEAGFAGVLKKPFTIEELSQTVAEVVHVEAPRTG